jgi:hypothetical protein
VGKFIEAFKDQYKKYAQSQGAGGCDTCGYGAEDVINDYDYETMLRDMDAWIDANFSKDQP